MAGTPEFTPPKPTRLAWDLDNETALTTIEDAHLAAQKLLNVRLSFQWTLFIRSTKRFSLNFF